MSRPLIALAGLVAAAGLGALAAGIAGGDPPAAPLVIDADRELGPVAVERAGDPGAATRTARARRRGTNTEVTFFQTTEPLEVAPETEEGATLSCPKGYKAIGGYFVSGRERTFLGLNAPQIAAAPDGDPAGAPPSKRNWAIAVYNTNLEPDQVDFGVVCLRKRR